MKVKKEKMKRNREMKGFFFVFRLKIIKKEEENIYLVRFFFISYLT